MNPILCRGKVLNPQISVMQNQRTRFLLLSLDQLKGYLQRHLKVSLHMDPGVVVVVVFSMMESMMVFGKFRYPVMWGLCQSEFAMSKMDYLSGVAKMVALDLLKLTGSFLIIHQRS
nr:hypothetical protein Iba_scaffold43426CG0010 [Ipomoea batatas]